MVCTAMASNNSSDNDNDYKFINYELQDDLKCPICLGVARDPLQDLECGRLFCRKCLEKLGRDKPCPHCRMKKPHYYEDKRSKRAIDALRVKCHNVERRCEWEGTVSTIEIHMAICQFTLLPCPNQCKALDEINCFMRKDLDDHLKNCPNRDYKCPHCGEKGTFSAITEKHDQVCYMKLVSCPNIGCTKTMRRRVVNRHVKSSCSYTILSCKYESIGCNVKMKRQDMAAHEQDDKFHLQVAMNNTLQLKKDNEALKNDHKELKALRRDFAELRRDMCSAINIVQLTLQPQPQIFKLTDYQKKKKNGEGFTFSPFYTHPRGYHVALRVDANGEGSDKGTHVTVYAVIVKGEYDTELNWPLIGKVTVTLLNQLEDRGHHVKEDIICARVGKSWMYRKFISYSALGYNLIKNTQYLKDDTLYFKMSVEAPLLPSLRRFPPPPAPSPPRPPGRPPPPPPPPPLPL